jgi:hypothetical protein
LTEQADVVEKEIDVCRLKPGFELGMESVDAGQNCDTILILVIRCATRLEFEI